MLLDQMKGKDMVQSGIVFRNVATCRRHIIEQPQQCRHYKCTSNRMIRYKANKSASARISNTSCGSYCDLPGSDQHIQQPQQFFLKSILSPLFAANTLEIVEDPDVLFWPVSNGEVWFL